MPANLSEAPDMVATTEDVQFPEVPPDGHLEVQEGPTPQQDWGHEIHHEANAAPMEEEPAPPERQIIENEADAEYPAETFEQPPDWDDANQSADETAQQHFESPPSDAHDIIAEVHSALPVGAPPPPGWNAGINHSEDEAPPNTESAPPKAEAETVETEVLPAVEESPPGKGITLLFMRVLGKKTAELTNRTLATRPPTELSPSLQAPPPPRRPGLLRRHALFLFTVVLPTALAVLYYSEYATDIYISESSYVVRSPNQKSAASGGLSALLGGAGFSGFSKAPDDVYAISQYIRSRDALKFLDEKLDLHTAWQSENIDFFHRFDPLHWDDSREALYEYYMKRVKVGAEPASGITSLTISGFTPEQVLKINELLLGKAEELVNVLNERGRSDLIRFAESEVVMTENKAKTAAQALSDFRNTQAVVDPEKQTMLHFEQIARLQEELIRTRGQLTQLRVFAPDSPHPPALELQVQTIEREIAAETDKITGGERSLASKAAEYQRLQLEREFADKQLAIAMSALESARSEAQRQQLYLETIAKPSLPDEATFPKRLRGIATTFILGLVAWGILAMLLAGVREHQY